MARSLREDSLRYKHICFRCAIRRGSDARAISATLDARWKVFICETILAEVEEVIGIRFNRSRNFTAATIQTLRDMCEIANEPHSRHEVAADPDDSPILRAAIGAGVDYLVTRDAALLALNPVESVRIIDLAAYLRLLQSCGFARD